ncbi:hypothetical protein V9T40_012413 [Parthenolecanium corni]|uniref:NADPH:adrenodoxin oxidoreductase, mitochondrial n=1 Tax=Parthenolecanium corni TaxID=536013 RepID=A0AAN9T760_9HEMI
MLKVLSLFQSSTINHKYTSFRKLSICIVGSGPAGFYCAQQLLKILPSSTIDIFEKLPVPFGLVRYGVAPDHAEVKNVINNFSKTASNPRVKFIGNVSLGEHFTLADLKKAYHAVFLSYGADQDVEFHVPGEKLGNIIPARKFVGWYNGLPAEKDIPVNLATETVAIFGQGNVAVDVARILLKSVDELKKTDIAEHALAKLAESKVKNVHLIGRRGPLQVAFTIKELREIVKLPGVQPIIDSRNFQEIHSTLSELPRPRKRLTELLIKTAAESTTKDPCSKKLYISFLRSPKNFVGSEFVEGVELTVNKFKSSSNVPYEEQKFEPTDKTEHFPTELIFKSIGYKSSIVDPEIPFYRPNCIGNTRVSPGVYSAGWVCTGPTGVILSTMNNAFNTANLILEDMKNNVILSEAKKPGSEYILSLLKSQNIRTVDWEGWKKIDEVEISRGKERSKPREKIVDIEEMVDIGGCNY